MDTKFFLGIGLAIVLVFAGAAVYTSFAKLPDRPAQRKTARYCTRSRQSMP